MASHPLCRRGGDEGEEGMNLFDVALGFGFGVIITVMVVVGWRDTHAYAVDAGHAEYYLDANHNRQWRWLPPCTQPKEPQP